LKAAQFSVPLLAALSVFGPVMAQDNQHSKYSGQEAREIKSLSPDDIAELRRGGGWGLAKAAELNGMPGPAHLLELQSEIGLSGEQVSALETIFADMQTQAIETGEHLIALEKKLETRFQDGDISDGDLHRILTEISQTRRDLRYVHLVTHLATPELLSKEQIDRYNMLRVYGSDPCSNIPEGHNPAMWKKHNGCEE